MESRTGSIGRAVLLLLCALAALAAARSIDVESEAEFLVDSASERVLEGFHFSRLERRKFVIIRHIFLGFFISIIRHVCGGFLMGRIRHFYVMRFCRNKYNITNNNTSTLRHQLE